MAETKWRRVAFIPEVAYFKPAGIPLGALEEVGLTVEEVEAVRLKDLESLEQEDCAQRMRISRPTFHRVLGAARRKIADALINGKAMRIEGGNFALASQPFRCRRDGHEWQVPFEAVASAAAGLPALRWPGLFVQPLASSEAVRLGARRGAGKARRNLIFVDEEKCTACGLCLRACAQEPSPWERAARPSTRIFAPAAPPVWQHARRRLIYEVQAAPSAWSLCRRRPSQTRAP
jgi:predicted DNA-binding protein (UPF0251 family)/NAD-dependent dihydropyrimidine dehydrogenase PreA subunit